MSGLQGYYNTVNSFGSNLSSAQSYLANYDDSYFTNTLSDFNEKVAKMREQGQSLVEAGAGAEGLYLGAKGLKASVKAIRAKFKKNDGDEDGQGEGGAEEETNEPELQMDSMPDDLDTSAVDGPISGSGEAAEGADTFAEPSVAAEASGPEATSGLDSTPVEAGGTEDEITAQLQSAFAQPETSAAQTTSFGAEESVSDVPSSQYFSTEAADEFDLPSGLGEAGDLSVGQDATTATRLADNPVLGTGERAGPEILGESTGGGTTGVTAEGADISIPQITSGDQSSTAAAQQAPSPADASTAEETTEAGQTTAQPSITAEPATTSGGASGASDASAATDTATTATTETTSVAEGASETAAATGAEAAGDVAGAVGAGVGEAVGEAAGATALEVGLGVASVALEAVPIVGGLAAIGIGLFDLFHHHSKPKPPPPPQQTTTQKGEVVVPSFDSVTDTPAAQSAF